MREGRLIPLDTLLRFHEIGSPESKPTIAYPEAASVVRYLIERKGIEKFRAAYRSLRAMDDPAQWSANEATFARLFGERVAELEKEWAGNLTTPPMRLGPR